MFWAPSLQRRESAVCGTWNLSPDGRCDSHMEELWEMVCQEALFNERHPLIPSQQFPMYTPKGSGTVRPFFFAMILPLARPDP